MEQESLGGKFKGQIEIYGDIVSSVWDDESFDIEDRPDRVLDPVAWDKAHKKD